jgi:uncharacterized iron-regulated protein
VRLPWLTGVLLTALASGCNNPDDLRLTDSAVHPMPHAWISPAGHDHPLAGRIWRMQDGEFIDPISLIADLQQTHFLLLGEKHDNPDHHRLRLAFVQALIRERSVTHLAMEMLDHSQQDALENLAKSELLPDQQVRDALRWDEQGWPWDRYGPLIRTAMQNGIRVVAANLTRQDVMAAYGAAEIVPPPPGTEASDLLGGSPATEGILDETMLALLAQEIDSSHCGLLPASQFPPMIRIQQARDLSMAASLYAASPQNAEGMRLLVAGNYHIRKDLGVPRYLDWLQRRSGGNVTPRYAVTTLAFLEVNDEVPAEDVDSYLAQSYASGAFDYVWFTAATEPQDYCASMTSDSVSGNR